MAQVLIVEDNASLRLAYASFTEEAGHSVHACSGVEEAMEYLSANTPDVILLDMLMPRVNGLELLQRYDVRQEHTNVKVIAFSNLTEERIIQQATDFGASLYLTKSLTTPKNLLDAIDAVLKK